MSWWPSWLSSPRHGASSVQNNSHSSQHLRPLTPAAAASVMSDSQRRLQGDVGRSLLHPNPPEAPLKGKRCSGEQVRELANTVVKLRTSASAGAGLQGGIAVFVRLPSERKETTRWRSAPRRGEPTDLAGPHLSEAAALTDSEAMAVTASESESRLRRRLCACW